MGKGPEQIFFFPKKVFKWQTDNAKMFTLQMIKNANQNYSEL